MKLILRIFLMAGSAAFASAAVFESVTNGFWAVNNASEAYAWNHPDRIRPAATDAVKINGHVVTVRQSEEVAQLDIAGGNLEIDAGFAVSLLQQSSWTGGTIAGRLRNAGTLSVSGEGAKRLSGNAENIGTLAVNSAAVSFDRGVLLTNPVGSVVQVSGASQFVSSGSGSGDLPFIDIAGDLQKTGAGTAHFGFGVLLRNFGTVEIQEGGLRCEMPYQQFAGTTRLNSAALSSLTSISIQGGELIGTGIITGNLINGATLRPAASSSSIQISGTFAQARGGVIEMEIASRPQDGQFSQIASSGLANLAGALQVRFAEGFVPVPGDMYPIIRAAVRVGRFTSIESFGLPVGLQLTVKYTGEGVELVVGLP